MVRCAVCMDKLDDGEDAVDVIWSNKKFYHRECYSRLRGGKDECQGEDSVWKD